MQLDMLAVTPPWRWPEEASDRIAGTLADRSADRTDRLLAAELAGEYVAMDEGLAGALLDVLRSPEEEAELRARAAIAFGPTLVVMDEPVLEGGEDLEERPVSEETALEIREVLADVFRDEDAPELVRRRALEASVRGTEEWHEEAVREAYRSEADAWRRTAVFGMAYVPGFEGEILESLASRDRDLRFEAVRAAGRRSLERAWPRVRRIIRSEREDRDLLLAAIRAAGTVGPDSQVVWEELHELQHAEDEEVADAADDALTTARLFEDVDRPPGEGNGRGPAP